MPSFFGSGVGCRAQEVVDLRSELGRYQRRSLRLFSELPVEVFDGELKIRGNSTNKPTALNCENQEPIVDTLHEASSATSHMLLARQQPHNGSLYVSWVSDVLHAWCDKLARAHTFQFRRRGSAKTSSSQLLWHSHSTARLPSRTHRSRC